MSLRKRIVVAFVTVASIAMMALGAVAPAQAAAEGSQPELQITEHATDDGFGVVVDSSGESSGISTLSLKLMDTSHVSTVASVLGNAYKSGTEKVSFDYSAGITKSEFLEAWETVVNDPAYFMSGTEISYVQSSRFGLAWYVTSATLTFSMNTSEIPAAVTKYESAVSEALTWVIDSMTAAQKCQALHDYLVRNCHYDTTSSEPTISHRSYGALVNDTAVCQGYALAYIDLLSRCGITCIYVSSQSMCHAWNMVQLDGNWYHVDVTWDDPTPDKGFNHDPNHNNFLKSKKTITSTGHYSWTPDYTASSDYSMVYGTYNGPACSHTYSAAVTEPTCVEGGYTTYTCTKCGDSYKGDYTVAKGHAPQVVDAVPATCTEAGLTEGTKCSVCGAVITEQATVPALGHDYGDWSTVTEATCTAEGVEKRVCSRCSQIEERSVDKRPHVAGAPMETVVTSATCTADGVRRIATRCTVCDAVLSTVDESIPKLAHTPEAVSAVPATCTEAGLTAGSKCSVCGEVLSAQETVSAVGHKPVEVLAVPATCTEAGLTAGTKCSVCGETLVEQQTVAAKGHQLQVVPGVAPTRTKPGLTDGEVCSVCGQVLVEQEEIPALGGITIALKSVKVVKNKKLAVKWTKVEEATGYVVMYRVKSATTWKKSAIKSSRLSTTLKELKAGKKYQVKVLAYEDANLLATSKVLTSAKIIA